MTYFSNYHPTGSDVCLALCEGRHSFPDRVEGSIFPEKINDPTDLDLLYIIATRVLEKFVGYQVNVFVSGYTPALIETINAAHDLGIKILLWHWDREKNDYFSQYVSVM